MQKSACIAEISSKVTGNYCFIFTGFHRATKSWLNS